MYMCILTSVDSVVESLPDSFLECGTERHNHVCQPKTATDCCCVLLCTVVHGCVLLSIVGYCCVLLCTVVHCCVLLCTDVYCCVLCVLLCAAVYCFVLTALHDLFSDSTIDSFVFLNQSDLSCSSCKIETLQTGHQGTWAKSSPNQWVSTSRLSLLSRRTRSFMSLGCRLFALTQLRLF